MCCSTRASTAFLSQHAVAPGQTLVVPTRHVESFHALTEPEFADMLSVARRVSAALRELGYTGTNIVLNDGCAAGQRVNHVHVHVIPRSRADIPSPAHWLSDALFARLYEPADQELAVMRPRLVTALENARSIPIGSSTGGQPREARGAVTMGEDCVVADDAILGHLTPTQRSLSPAERPPVRIGSGSIIRSGTVIYAGTSLGAGADVGHGVVIRENTVIGDDVYIFPGTQIHARVRIAHDVRVQGFVGNGSVIEDHASCHGMLIHRYDARRRGARESAPIIRAGALVGVGSTIIGGVTIGQEAVVGAGSIVTQSVAPHAIVVGAPARVVTSTSREDEA